MQRASVGAKLIRNKDVVKILEFSKRYKEMEYYGLNLLYMNQNSAPINYIFTLIFGLKSPASAGCWARL